MSQKNGDILGNSTIALSVVLPSLGHFQSWKL